MKPYAYEPVPPFSVHGAVVHVSKHAQKRLRSRCGFVWGRHAWCRRLRGCVEAVREASTFPRGSEQATYAHCGNDVVALIRRTKTGGRTPNVVVVTVVTREMYDGMLIRGVL